VIKRPSSPALLPEYREKGAISFRHFLGCS